MGQDTRFWLEDEQRQELVRLRALERAVAKAVKHCPHACMPPCPFDRAMAEVRPLLTGSPDRG